MQCGARQSSSGVSYVSTSSCSKCSEGNEDPSYNGASGCNGDCQWKNEECVSKGNVSNNVQLN